MDRVMDFVYNIFIIGAAMAAGTCLFFILGGVAAVRIPSARTHPHV